MLGEGLSPKAPRFLNDKDLNAIKDTIIDWGDGTVEPFLKKIKVKIPAPGPSVPRPAIDISDPPAPIVDVDGPNISGPKLPNPGEPRPDEPEQYETVYSLGSKHRYKDTFINGLIDSKEPVTIIVTNISCITEYFKKDYQPALITVSKPDTYHINLDVLTSIEQIGSDVTTLEYAFSPDSNNRISNVMYYYSAGPLPGEPCSSATNIRAFYDGRPDVPKYSEYGESSYRNRHIQGVSQMIFGLGEDIFCFKKNAFRYCTNISNIKGLFAHSTLVEDKETFFNNGSISKLNSILYSSKDESEKITADTYSKIKLAQIDNILEYFPSATNLDFAFLDTNYDIVSQKNLISSINALPNKVSTTNCLSIFRQSYIKDYIHNIKEYGGEPGMPPSIDGNTILTNIDQTAIDLRTQQKSSNFETLSETQNSCSWLFSTSSTVLNVYVSSTKSDLKVPDDGILKINNINQDSIPDEVSITDNMGRSRSVKLMSDASGKYLVPNITNTELTAHLSDKKPIMICINNLGTILSGNTLDSTDDRLPVFSVSEKLQNANVLIELVQLGKDIKNLNNFFQKNSISFLVRELVKKQQATFMPGPEGPTLTPSPQPDIVLLQNPIWGPMRNNFRYAFAESKIYSNPEDFYLECQDGKSRKGPISFDPYEALPPGETMVPRFDLIDSLNLTYGARDSSDLTGMFYKTEFCGKINPRLFSENKYIHENAFHIEKEQNDDCIILNADGTRYNPYDVIPKDWNGNL